jgi:hypothetical protein
MEVDPPDRSAEQHFLHVVVPYGAAAGKEGKTFSPQPGAFKLVEDASQEGVSLETAGGAWQVRFNRQGPPGGVVSVRRGADHACTAALEQLGEAKQDAPQPLHQRAEEDPRDARRTTPGGSPSWSGAWRGQSDHAEGIRGYEGRLGARRGEIRARTSVTAAREVG